MKREDYERNTVASLEDIKRKCEMLLQEAEKSDKYHLVYATKVIMDSKSPCFHDTSARAAF